MRVDTDEVRWLRQELEELSKQLMIVTAARQAIEVRPATPSEMSLTELVLSVMEGQGAIEKAAIVDAVKALDPDANPRSVGAHSTISGPMGVWKAPSGVTGSASCEDVPQSVVVE